MGKFKKNIDRFFLDEENPFTEKSKLNLVNIGAFLIITMILIIILSSMWEGRDQPPKDKTTKSLENDSEKSRAKRANSNNKENSNDYSSALNSYKSSSSRKIKAARQYQASQIIETKQGMYNQFLPHGTTLKVKLINKVNSSDQDSPIIAVLPNNILKDGEVIIPQNSKFIGSGGLNSYSGRLCVQFNALVFPDSQEYELNGTAVMPDGSSCIKGKYNSGGIRKHGSQFLGDFASGLAEGMKSTDVNDKGIPFNKGGLKNGLLNGVSRSSSNWSRSTANQYGNTKPKVTIKNGVSFLIFLKKRLDL